MKKRELIVLVGGGTGGHIYPLVAIGEELEERRIPFVYIGSSNSREEEVIGKNSWRFISIQSGKFRRYINYSSVFQNLVDLIKVVVGFFQSLVIMFQLRPQAVLSKGGYVALPVVYAAKILGIRTVVHESDAVIGLSNRLSKPVADVFLTMFSPKTYPESNERFLQVGIPIRRTLRLAAKLKAPKKTRPIVLILPGSQGSTSINRLVKPILVNLLQIADVVHMTGERDYEEFALLREGFPLKQRNHYKVFPFIDRELPYYYQSSDLIICRASATTIAEAALFARALYLIPLPTSASNHQQKNAQMLQRAQAAVVGNEKELTSQQLIDQLFKLLSESEQTQLLGENLQRYCRSNETIDLIIEVLINEKKK